jgi:hypothetical protein
MTDPASIQDRTHPASRYHAARARVDDDQRAHIRLYDDDADDKEPSDLAAACAELGMTLSAEERAGFHAYADAALPQGSTLVRLRTGEEL